MAEYVLVENGTITEYHGDLPKSWRNVSGLNLLKDSVTTLVSHGWYPVTKVSVNYDSSTHKISRYIYEIFDLYVTETPEIVPIPPEEIPSFADLKSEFLNQLRGERNKKLQESDWTQLLDSPLGDAVKEQWRAYRQALRDLPGVYQDDQTLSIEAVIWPNM